MVFWENLKSFFSFPDYTALVFVVCPLIGVPALGLSVGFYFLLTIVLYTVMATFVTIHTDEVFFLDAFLKEYFLGQDFVFKKT